MSARARTPTASAGSRRSTSPASAWTKRLFPTYRRGMEKVEWGILYNQYHERDFDLDVLQRRVAELYADEEVKDKSGIYEYVFDGRQSHLNLRQFEDWQKQTMFERQKGLCPECVKEGVKRQYDISEMHADHIKPWHLGGKTELDNPIVRIDPVGMYTLTDAENSLISNNVPKLEHHWYGDRYSDTQLFEEWLMRSLPVGDHGNQCVYDAKGNLLIGPPSGGTADWRTPGLGYLWGHGPHDVYTYELAEKLKRIADYYSVRPSW